MSGPSPTWFVNILPQAGEDLEWLRKRDRGRYVKAFNLTREIARDPRTGSGKPERLKFFKEEVWSRRISVRDRLVYLINEAEREVDIVRLSGPLRPNQKNIGNRADPIPFRPSERFLKGV